MASGRQANAVLREAMKTPKAIWQGSFTILGVKLRCYVLDDGRRVINADDIAKLFGEDHLGTDQKGDLDAFAKWQRGAKPLYGCERGLA